MLAVVARLTQDGFESQSDGERELRLPPPLQSPPRSNPRATTILTSKLKPPGPFDRVLGSSAYASGVGERPKPKGSQVSFADDSAFKPRRARSDTRDAVSLVISAPRRRRSHAEGPRRRLRAREHRRAPEDAVRPLVPPRLSFSPAVAQLCAVLTDALSSPSSQLARFQVEARPRAHERREPHPRHRPTRVETRIRVERSIPPRGVAPSTRPRRGSSETPAGRFRDAPSDETFSEATVASASAEPSLVEKRAPAKRAKLAPARAPARARPRACPRLRPRAKRRRRLGHPRASLGSQGRGNLFQARSRVGDLEPHVGRRAQRASRDGPHGVETRDRES